MYGPDAYVASALSNVFKLAAWVASSRPLCLTFTPCQEKLGSLTKGLNASSRP